MSEEYKKSKLRVIFFALLMLIFAGGLFLLANSNYGSDKVSVMTEKTRYDAGEELKVEINNEMESDICFSSCYPYFFQDNRNGWENMQYGTCDAPNLASDCVPAKSVKAFAISLNIFSLQNFIHRLAVPACVGCTLGEQFRADKIFYSNEFETYKQ